MIELSGRCFLPAETPENVAKYALLSGYTEDRMERAVRRVVIAEDWVSGKRYFVSISWSTVPAIAGSAIPAISSAIPLIAEMFVMMLGFRRGYREQHYAQSQAHSNKETVVHTTLLVNQCLMNLQSTQRGRGFLTLTNYPSQV